MQPYDIVNNPLKEGPCLIEAGAGTGKTYALTAIFLRLMFEQAIGPDRILVVTFTTAATAELRDRLRRQLTAIRRFLEGNGPLDGTLHDIVVRAGDPHRVRAAVATALREFDRIPIFTIHGFCQRLLGELAFETDSPFAIELLTDPSGWIQGAAEDYWRQMLYPAAPELVDYAIRRLRGPDTLAVLYQRFGLPDLRIVPALPELPRIDFTPYRQGCTALSRQWSAVRGDIESLLQDPALSGTVYGGLKPAPGGARGETRRSRKVEGWCRALDDFLKRTVAPLPPCPSLVYFTRDKIAAATRKGRTPPSHAFFNACQDLYATAERLGRDLEQWLAALRYGFFGFAERHLDALKQTRQTLFFDDLLIRVSRALEGQRGRRLAAAVRRRYQAALVDEFQDTDPVQYGIFKRLFDTADHRLFMIGDPKQAIYGFRGADIFAYLQAVRQTPRKYTLVENWRSRPELIQAVNLLFDSHPRPFRIPEIVYHPAVAAPESAASDADATAAPMTFWVMPAADWEKRDAARILSKPEATGMILSAIAAETGRLLRPPTNAPDAASEWSAYDIAVLVRTNRQARMVKACMQATGIPAVIYNAGSVFETSAADELDLILQAVIQPGDIRKLKTALATRLFAIRGDRLAFGEQGPDWWEDLRQRFWSYQHIWRESGFYPFFQRMLTENRIAERLLTLTDGERRLTNLLHLAELLQQAAAVKRFGLQEALRWLRNQKTRPSGRIDEQQLRMESDAQAVTIITIHKSKGLEFPIVFYPFGWEADTGRGEFPLFHDPGADMRRTLYIGAEANAAYADRAADERRAEALRRLYVAVTRARNRCYLVWGDLPGADTSALGYLLSGSASGAEHLSQSQDRAAGADSALRRLAQESDGRIVVGPLPAAAASQAAGTPSRPELRAERSMKRRLDLNWSIASFSSLIRTAQTGEDTVEDRDREERSGPPPPIGLAPEAAAAKLKDDIHLFPGGVRAGNLFHRLFEVLDYHQADTRGWHSRVAAELELFGFETKWSRPVARLIQNVLETPLPPLTPPFALNRLAPEACVKEMPFTLALKPLQAGSLRAVFRKHDLPLPAGDLDRQLKKLQFAISGGYLRGFIDLVFNIQDRFYLLDWKSNYLGDRYADYDAARIASIMAADYYFLQYHLYVVALDQFLRLRLPGYAYEKDFGGVFYLFIRGMQADRDDGRGIFYDRPRRALVDDLRHLLLRVV